MPGSKFYLSAVGCVLLCLSQRAAPQQDEPSSGCPPLTKNSLSITCKANGEKQPCQEAGVSSRASVKWKKSVAQKQSSIDELVCDSSGAWKKATKKFVPPGYTEVPNVGVYKFYKDMRLDWYLASYHCFSEGTHLAIIDSFEELEAMKDIGVVNLQGEAGTIHLGIHSLFPDKFQTLFGGQSAIGGELKWGNKEPWRGPTHHCVCFTSFDSMFHNGDCVLKRPFICEAPQTPILVAPRAQRPE